ncbi:MAG: COX15/CtaA family protein [Pseudomonadota bacterium]
MSKSIFEEVGETPGDGARPSGGGGAGGAEAARLQNRKLIRIWLFVLAALVIVQILVGGLTRLTDSGLSITEWRPVTGVIPPLSDAAWEAELEKYRSTTEYQVQNRGMSMAEFKVIYWWEWGHRQWGRLIGLVFVLPFAWFLYQKTIPQGWTGRIALLGGLGLLQGVIGWWMVASGLTGRLDVSQYRLAVHLGLAFVILGMIFWCALSLGREDWALLQARRRREPSLRLYANALVGLAFLQILMGAFVAGMDAGRIYTQWPGMGEGIYPAGEPFLPFDEPAAAQFVHRVLGYLLVLAALFFWWASRRSAFAKTRLWGAIAAGLVTAQAALGIVTLIHAAPPSWSILHQFGAVLLFAALVHAAHQAAYPKDERIAA